MAVAHRPETFIALRARHEALRIAEAVIRGGGVNVEQLNCHTCGAELDWKRASEQVAIDCPACGAVNELPCHLRYRIPPSGDEDTGTLDYASVEPDRRHWWNGVVPTAMAVPERHFVNGNRIGPESIANTTWVLSPSWDWRRSTAQCQRTGPPPRAAST